MELVILIVLALIIGSFLNVVIYRLPLMMQGDHVSVNLAFPASHCPTCKTPLRFWHNIPLISFISLQGKCAFCSAPISRRYPLVELLSVMGSVVLFLLLEWDLQLGAALLLFYILLALTFIDIDTHMLPDCLTLPLLMAGLGANSLMLFTTPSDAIWGAIAGFLMLWLFDLLYFAVRKRHGIGMGDSKLLGALGAWFGLSALLPIILAASLLGIIAALLFILLKKLQYDMPIAFGPFLAISGFAYLCYFYS